MPLAVERLHHDFAGDLIAALRYYDEISSDTGNRFRKAVLTRLSDVKARPESFGYLIHPLRFANIERFPYVLIFEHDEPIVFVAGLYHAASDPSHWHGRENLYRRE